jgi:uncharacterized protein YyaL (SSP411 family)
VSGKSNLKSDRIPNRLIHEKSPYLLQHAYNPVDWYPWGPEAFGKARRENKLIFLSIGYSTCHWCHVMKRESFEDSDVARLMNHAFVSIKVDREERPDIDNLYMTACQMFTNNCGWPLNIILTPDKKPFFAGTYFPKETNAGRIGLLDLVSQIEELWMTRPEELLNSANEITAKLDMISGLHGGEKLGENILNAAYEQLTQAFDEETGGFNRAPKFPTPHHLIFLLRYWKRTADEKALHMVEKTLQSMRRGGIYDQVGFGFHRYSTNFKWLVPHFEKMLYDQALLTIAYTEAYQATQNPEYRTTGQEILAYVLREMKDPEGGFYSAEDAESEGEEGKFYLWTIREIREILKEDADLAAKTFNIEQAGNFIDEAYEERNGANILHLKKSHSNLAYDLRISEQELRRRMESIRQRLFAAREKRVHPHKDDKILADWNGLMIAALAKAAQVCDEPTYVEAAKNAAHFILNNMLDADGRLLHRYREGQSAIPAYADDYTFLIWGLIELYETTFEANHLQTALSLTNDLIKHYWDEQNGGFYFTPDDGEETLIRKKEVYDGAIPSGNSIGMLNLLRLGRMTYNPDLKDKAEQIRRAFSSKVGESPTSFTQLLAALDFVIGPSYEVVIAGDSQTKDTIEMIRTLRSRFLPNMVVLLNPTEQKSPDIFRVAESLKDQTSIDNRTTAYVCVNYACKQPVTDPKKMMKLLGVKM